MDARLCDPPLRITCRSPGFSPERIPLLCSLHKVADQSGFASNFVDPFFRLCEHDLVLMPPDVSDLIRSDLV